MTKLVSFDHMAMSKLMSNCLARCCCHIIILNLQGATGPIVRCEGVSDSAQLIWNKASAQSKIARGEATALGDNQYCSNFAIPGDGNSSRIVGKR